MKGDKNHTGDDHVKAAEDAHKEKEKNEQKSSAKHREALEHIPYEEMEAKLNEAETKANDNWDKFLRSQAELENVRRRFDRDITSAHKYGNEKLILELLPIIDGIERGLALAWQQDEAKKIHEGMAMTLNMLLKALEKFGVKQIDPMDKQFDPTWHQAISTKEDPNAKPNTILEVLQKGYILNDRLLRPALVVVAK